MSFGNFQQLTSNTQTSTQANDPRLTQAKTASAAQLGLQPGMAPAHLGPAIQYANIGPGLAPIPFLPVAGLGGLQLLPQVSVFMTSL